MSKRNTRLIAHCMSKFLSEFPDLRPDGSQVICLICDQNLLCWNRSLCRRHINSEKHRYKKSGQRPYSQFVSDLVFMLSVCNLPFHLIDKEQFCQFWKKYNPAWKLPRRITLQRYLLSVRDKLENNIKSQMQNKKLWVTVDETTDSKKHSVVNVILRILDPDGPSSPYLLASKRLEECTGEAIQDLILTTLQNFQLSPHHVLIFVSNDAPPILHAGHILKNDCPNLLHITCILHALHLTTEIIRKYYPDVDALIARTKAVFLKSPKHTLQFHKQCPGIAELPQPIHIQWETWLNAALYYFQHFNQIKALVLQFDAKESTAIRDSQIQFKNAQVEADLKTIHTNYAVLVDAITKLQNTSLSLGESLQIVDDVQTVLQTLNDEKGIHVREKFNTIFTKNTDFVRLKQIYSNSADMDPLLQFRDHFQYVKITSLDAEQSSLLYKNMFSPLRSSLKEMTIETCLMLQMYSRAQSDF